MSILYWLFKADPDDWSWQQQKDKYPLSEEWSGVRNYQARNQMRLMKKGDKGFFYHSQKEREIVGIVEITNQIHQDYTSNDPRWECVDVTAYCDFKKKVSLQDIKSNPKLSDMDLLRYQRLSVQHVKENEWLEICRMGETNPNIRNLS